MLGKLKKKAKDGEKQHKPPQQKHPEDSDEFGSEYTDTDDERVHDFEIGQENYLLQVALATSAQDFDHQSTNGIAAEAATPGACELSKKYWRDGRWVLSACSSRIEESCCPTFLLMWNLYSG